VITDEMDKNVSVSIFMIWL